MLSYIEITPGTGVKVGSRQVTENDGITKEHQTLILSAGTIALPTTPQIDGVSTTGVYPDNAIDIRGYGHIIFKPVFTDSTQTATLRIHLFDVSGTNYIGVTSDIDVSATDVVEGSNYLGEFFVLDNTYIGASYIKVELKNDLSAGTVSFYIGGF